MKKIIIAYVPVIHRGYLDYLASTGASEIYALTASDLPEFPQLTREMRALSLDELEKALKPFGYEVKPFASLLASEWRSGMLEIFMPEDDVTRKIKEKYFLDQPVTFGSWFLRWDWSKSTNMKHVEPTPDRVISRKGCSKRLLWDLSSIIEASKKSSDWWRQVGALAKPKSGETLVAYNKHFPNEYAPYLDGDPRDNFGPGEFIEVSTALHAEIALLAEAARRGISLEGAELYVSVFPCGGCAPAVAEAGFGSLYYQGGYSNLNGYETLRRKNVEIVKIED